GLAGDPAYPPHKPNMPPVPLGKTGTRYARAMNQLGWHWWPSDIAVATTDHRLLIGVACEGLPEEHNCVTLDPALTDSHGIPAPKIDYAISENTRLMMEHGIARASEILAAAGATYISCSRPPLKTTGHLLCAARY